MTYAELRKACEHNIEMCGHEAYVMLVVRRKKRPRHQYTQLWPGGPRARVVGQVGDDGEKYMVDAKAKDILRLTQAIETGTFTNHIGDE